MNNQIQEQFYIFQYTYSSTSNLSFIINTVPFETLKNNA